MLSLLQIVVVHIHRSFSFYFGQVTPRFPGCEVRAVHREIPCWFSLLIQDLRSPPFLTNRFLPSKKIINIIPIKHTPKLPNATAGNEIIIHIIISAQLDVIAIIICVRISLIKIMKSIVVIFNFRFLPIRMKPKSKARLIKMTINHASKTDIILIHSYSMKLNRKAESCALSVARFPNRPYTRPYQTPCSASCLLFSRRWIHINLWFGPFFYRFQRFIFLLFSLLIIRS